VIEFDPRVESLLDTRAARRLVDLEVRDVQVPPAEGREDVALFFRVLGAEQGRVRVELWERGEAFGVRMVSAADGRSLGARRVALAAAELARLLRASRVRAQRAAERERLLAAERERIERERTLDGPVALRSAIFAESVSGGDLYLVGPQLTLELSAKPFGRVDLGVGMRGGELDPSGGVAESVELELGFSRRFVLTRALDLDAGVSARAGVLMLGGVAGVDDIRGQRETWWSRALASVRVEPRLSRHLRFDAGVAFGLVLRRVPFELVSGRRAELGGVFFGGELGLVFTPESP
jgi:hypothetical protein